MKSVTTDVISVIIPAYNSENYIQESLDSLYNQVLSVPIEIIVVNDGSTDKTADILLSQGNKIKVITQDNLGAVRAKNAGFRKASGNFICSLDSDDLYLSTKLDQQWKFLKEHLEYDMVFCKIKQFISPELDDGTKKIPKDVEILTSMNFAGGMYRASVFEVNGYIDESILNYGDFVDWFAKAKEKSISHSVIDEILMLRRVHDLNLGKTGTHQQKKGFLKVLRAKINRSKSQD
jgi:glycosyltransferase involved in cell wall biosynthesis